MTMVLPTPRISRLTAGAPRRREQGVVLFVALIVLVAMSLAGVALMRSADAGMVVAGNMAFKQSAVNVADRGTQEAATWLSTNSAGTALQNTNAAAGYYSSYVSPDPDWFDINSWAGAMLANGGAPDAAGNTVRYLIHRMCTVSNAPYNSTGPTNYCGQYTALTAGTGGSMAVGAPVFVGTPQLYYRITTRVDGPRDTVSVIQTSVLVPIGS